jgi:hypothetical protein
VERGVIGTDEAVVVFENMRVVELETKLNDFLMSLRDEGEAISL